MSDGTICPNCGGLMRRTGSCHTCPNCGETTGCGRNTPMRLILPILAAACLLASAGATAAQAETTAQRDVAKERVVREAVKLQKQQRYRSGTKTITPEARYFIWGTTDADAEVTMRWRIRVRTAPQPGTSGWLVCRGRVTVRAGGTGDVNDPTQLRASLATDSCIA